MTRPITMEYAPSSRYYGLCWTLPVFEHFLFDQLPLPPVFLSIPINYRKVSNKSKEWSNPNCVPFSYVTVPINMPSLSGVRYFQRDFRVALDGQSLSIAKCAFVDKRHTNQLLSATNMSRQWIYWTHRGKRCRAGPMKYSKSQFYHE